MRIPVVRFGDPTTTGGKVLAVRANIHDNTKKIALHGEHATCGNCKGSWPMFGTGEGMSEHGTQVVIQGDRVLCPCGKNRVIAGEDVGCFIHKDPGGSNTATTAESLREPAPAAQHDEQFTLLDDARRPLSNVRYRIVTDSGQVFIGTTNGAGQTQRVLTQGSSALKLQLEKQLK
ncbi:putative Zn-binding protein involved in type VI secretion [Paraburkholderia sp. GAS448]|uniref:PAAR domain-containing protein n=1 Tax=Paraburkholderia sp. GAS448 TaxID=3035136 RepID=UPI003D23BA0A